MRKCHHQHSHPSVRTALVVLASLLLVLVVRLPAHASAPTSFQWDQFKGVTLKILLHENQWQGSLIERLSEFEKLTGIKVTPENYSQVELWNVLERTLPQPGRVDVFATVPGLDAIRYHRMGWMRPVNGYLEDAHLTTPDYNWADFFPQLRAGMTIRGAILGPPVMGEHLALLYRKDIFQQQKLAVPKTLAELEAAARTFHGTSIAPRGGRGVGLVGRGQGPYATSVYGALLHAFGGTWLDASGQTTLEGPESLAALELLRTLLGRYGPQDVANFGWQEATGYFASGQAAMYLEAGSVFPLLETADSSKVKGQVGYALFPKGPGGPGATLAVRGLAIAKQSANPEAAWLFCQWATLPPQIRQALAKGVLVPRASVWENGNVKTPIPADLASSFQEAGRIGNPTWAPPLVAVTAAREAVGQAITATLTGGDVRQAARQAAARLRELIRTTEAPDTRRAQAQP
jgi:multiple sugar transport system substrate-binding protein